jgi:hypothetical protein
VELDHRRAEPQRSLELALVRLDEQADADVRAAQLVDIISKVVVLAGGVEAPSVVRSSRFSGTMQAACGRWRWRCRASRRSPPSRGSAAGRSRHQPLDVGVGDVPAVLAQVRGDAVGALPWRTGSRRGRVGMVAAARVADGRDVVDVQAETEPAVTRPPCSRA